MKPLIIFDCDGVLVDSEQIASKVFADHLTGIGIPHTQQQCLERFTGLSLDSCKSIIEMETGKYLPVNFFTDLQRETLTLFERDLQPVSGIVDVLDFLVEKDWLCCVASSGSYDKMAATLGKTKLHRYFDGRIFSASDVQQGKPAPDLFLRVAERQQFHPANCIVIEDSQPGIMAGLAAGMSVCAFGNRHNGFSDARVFSDMAELPALLIALQQSMMTV
jgi:HAD superfamily hydrolase (TIGR01509 family)